MNWQWTRLTFPNGRGLRLSGLLLGPETVCGQPVVVVCHGFLGTKEGRGKAVEMAQALAASLGWTTFLFDLAGNGESEGDFADLTLSGQIADLTSAVDQAQRLGFGPIVTLGRSFGGTTVICQAPGDARVRAVGAWSSPALPRRIFTLEGAVPAGQGLFRWEAPLLERAVCLKEGFFTDLQGHDVLDCIGRISPRPIFLAHGGRDELVPSDDARILWEAAAHPKQILVVPEADHVYTEHYQQLWQEFFIWIEGLGLSEGKKPGFRP